MRVFLLVLLARFLSFPVSAQVRWIDQANNYGSLPKGIKIFRSTDPLGGKPSIAYYLEADLNDRSLVFGTDTTFERRLTPTEFYNRNNLPYVVVNASFFSFATNRNLNAVIKDGSLVGYNIHSLPGKAKDTLTYRHPYGSAIGISKNRKPDIAWLYTDSSSRYPWAVQKPLPALRDSQPVVTLKKFRREAGGRSKTRKWKMEVAVGGGPVLVQNYQVQISANQELKFTGQGLKDRHPRTAMGYTPNGKLIILVIEGRNPGKAEGATLEQTAEILRSLGCTEAINLDGGGSSCMLVNGKETILPSDNKGIQRPVPAVFMIWGK